MEYLLDSGYKLEKFINGVYSFNIMPRIKLFDGTRDSKYGIALMRSFAEMAKYQRVIVNPKPGSIDIESFDLVEMAARRAYHPRRGQVHYLDLLNGVLEHANTKETGKNTFILTDKDLYADNLNWCFGSLVPDSVGGRHLVMSTYRIPDLETLAHVAIHELGHMFGAASSGRRNTVENLGSHCTNFCVMEQRLSVPEMTEQARLLADRDNKFCYQCQHELSDSY